MVRAGILQIFAKKSIAPSRLMVKKRSGEERVGFSTGSKPPFLIKTPVIYVVIYKMITISLLNTSMTARRRGKEMTPTGSPVAIATLPFSNLEIPPQPPQIQHSLEQGNVLYLPQLAFSLSTRHPHTQRRGG